MSKTKKNQKTFKSKLAESPDFNLVKEYILSPHFSEKASKNEGLHKYTIRVNKKANKNIIKDIIEKTYKVKVLKVNILKNPAKKKLTQRGNLRTSRKSVKKAIITIEAKKKLDLTKIK